MAWLVFAACGSLATPDASTALCTDTAPAAPTFSNMQVLFTGCTQCHNGSVPLDLLPAVAYADLVGKAAPSYTSPPTDESCGGTLVVAGSPSTSYLFQKLSTTSPCAGAGMPLDDFGVTEPLVACEQQLVHDWIAAGAPD